MMVVFQHCANRIARQSVLTGKSGNLTVFHPAQPAVGCGPERTARIELKTADTSLAQSIGACIRCADLTAFEIRQATRNETNPQPPLYRVGEQSPRIFTP